MNQRVLKIEVFEGDDLLFEKAPASAQDLIAALSLFERDNLKVVSTISVIDVRPASEK